MYPRGIGDDDEAGLLERAGDVVGEVTGGETSSNGGGTGVRGELQDGALSVGTSGDGADIGGVVDGGDDTGGQDNLLPARSQSSDPLQLPFPPRFLSAGC